MKCHEVRGRRALSLGHGRGLAGPESSFQCQLGILVEAWREEPAPRQAHIIYLDRASSGRAHPKKDGENERRKIGLGSIATDEGRG